MSTNLWNLKNSKQRFGIRQRTQAHKRHLISLVNVKSSLRNILHEESQKSPAQKMRSLNAPYNSRIKFTINRQNKQLASRITNINHNKRNRMKMNSTNQLKFLEITQNLRTVSSINRNSKFKQIQAENQKMLSRLVNTTSSVSLSRKIWAKDIKSNQAYRTNISKSRYQKPDYSQEASRLLDKNLGNKAMTYKHLKYSFTTQELPDLSSRVQKAKDKQNVNISCYSYSNRKPKNNMKIAFHTKKNTVSKHSSRVKNSKEMDSVLGSINFR